MPDIPFYPDIPLIVPETPLHTCILLATVRAIEYVYWPRRHVAAVAVINVDASLNTMLTMLCLN